jgi:hypothetical protein
VDAPFRRHGVARVPIAQVEAAARAAGAGGILILTGFDTRARKRRIAPAATPMWYAESLALFQNLRWIYTVARLEHKLAQCRAFQIRWT